MKKHISAVVILLVFITGLFLLLYPTVSDYINSLHQSRAIAGYAENVAGMDHEKYEKMMREAAEYNAELARRSNQWLLTQEDQKKYNEVLNPGNDGIMGYIEIPKINCNLPIYHSVDEGILQTSIGNIPGSSVPVGGEGTHCVLSGHRGLPSAKLFSELDRLSEGDSFLIRTLDEVLTYEVDRILIVLPKDTDALCIEENGDYCTLVTCTPYGVNSHRMLVRGRRIENASAAKTVRVAADAIQVEPIIVGILSPSQFCLFC